ncbi:Immunity protein SdpI [compost metagenome]
MKKMIIPCLFTLVAVAISLFFYGDLPERMVIHFGSNLKPDNWVSTGVGAFLLPALILFVGAITIISMRFEKNIQRRQRNEASLNAIVTILSTTLFAVHCFTIAYNLGYKLSVAVFVTLIVGIVFVLMGNLMPRLRQSSRQYPKLPEHVQNKALRFQGRSMLIIGFIFLLLSLLPNSYIFPAFFIGLSLFLVTIISSVIYYSRLR